MEIDIHTELAQEIERWAAVGHPAIMQRFVQHFGVKGVGAPLPEGMARGQARRCFMNAYHMAYTYGFVYCEGYAIQPSLGLLIHHAWVTDPESNRIIDITWDAPETATYLGVPFDMDTLHDAQRLYGSYGLLDTGAGINTKLIFGRMPELEALAHTVVSRRSTLALQSITKGE